MFVDCHSLSLAPVKSRLVLPFWYRLTQVVLEKRPLNGCCCCCRRCDLWFQVHEKVVDYTRCTSNTSVVCADYIETHPGATNCSCRVTFQLTDDFPVVAFLPAKMSATHTHTHTLIQRPFFRDYLGEPDPERQNQSGFYWSNRQWVAFSEKGPLNGRVCVYVCVCVCVCLHLVHGMDALCWMTWRARNLLNKSWKFNIVSPEVRLGNQTSWKLK